MPPSQNCFARTVILSSAAERAHRISSDSVSRFDHAYEGMEWKLARNPLLGTAVRGVDHGNHYAYVHASQSKNAPSLWAAYRFDDDQVEIIALKVV